MTRDQFKALFPEASESTITRNTVASLDQASPDAEYSYEEQLHNDIMEECDRRGWLYFHGAMCRRTYRTEGEPDFIILAPPVGSSQREANGFAPRVLLIECKSATGKLSPAQRDVAAHAAKLGHTIHVVRFMQEFKEICACAKY